MYVQTIFTIPATNIGSAVRLTTSKGLTFAIVATAIIAGAIGLTHRPNPVIICIGAIIVIVSTPNDLAILGINGAKLKNAAFPEPIKKAEMASKIETKMIMAIALNPIFLAYSMRMSTKPTDISPVAKT